MIYNDQIFSFFPDHVCIYIRSSKTDIYHEGKNCIIARTGKKTCPVTLLERYIDMSNITDGSHDFIFRSVSYCKSTNSYKLKGVNHLSYTRVREIVLNLFSAIDLDKKKIGVHSLRSGGATAAANFGIPDRLFKRHGRWLSEKAKDGYIKDEFSKPLSVSQNKGI